jgi:hypothetical protein
MNKLFLFFVMVTVFIIFSHIVYCEDNESKPFIVSIMPDSLFSNYEYSQTVFIVVSVESRIMGDPIEGAISDLKDKIIETCKANKFDGFILNQMVFAKPFDEGKLIGYGTLLKKKVKNVAVK